jgi:hypothetical protein
MTKKRATQNSTPPKIFQTKKERFSKIMSNFWFGVKFLFVLLFVFIALFVLYSSIVKYYSLDNDKILAQNYYIISNRISKTAYRLKVYADFLITSIPKYQDDLNNVHKYGSTLQYASLEDWHRQFNEIKTEADSTTSIFKQVINAIRPQPFNYDKIIVYFDAGKTDIINIVNDLDSMRFVDKYIIGLEDKHTLGLYKLSSIVESVIAEHSVEKAFAKWKLLNIDSEK